MSSKAAKLGAGASFQQAQPISSRRAAINAATAAPTEGAPPPVTLPVRAISLNPDNPRTELGDLADLAGSLRDHGQKQAITIMSRFSYLEANPTRERELEPGTKYVVIDGNSRLAAAREASLESIKVMLDDSLGNNPDELLESALVANIHRQDLSPLDEAKALQQLLGVHGTQEALAVRLHRSQGWISQRLALLTLTPELKHKLEAGEERPDLLRLVGRKNPEEQEEHLQRLKDRRAQEKADKHTGASVRRSTGSAAAESALRPTPAAAQMPDEPAHYDVIRSAGEDSEKPGHASPVATVPDPRPAPALSPRQVKMPWADGVASMDIIFDKVSERERHRLVGRYVELLGGPEAFVADLTAATSTEFLQRVVDLLLEDR
ncbi:ParB/RepB/Spo0J family partition protein [Streptomyces spongiicola]|uniref:ParB/RepB/Spo0J family partition protein n=1 Tax=Streptomyces spongiicola TaxID=1690221 RepID=A0A388T3I1_9ACTN|nr:ParB/RepB/Spo0J family partition protein [Streptomyces spongiicola]GBQ03498.1 ParB/RepB/Spo0J family partition protein [Streptomyces spongiicola]